MSQTKGLPFTKMQALGNDFVVLDGISQPICLNSETVQALADRRRGIGCDQVLLVEPTQQPNADFRYRIWNADGSEVEHCGNGVRCVARFVYDHGLARQEKICFETLGGLTEVTLLENDSAQVNMGAPKLRPDDIPFQADAVAPSYLIEANDQRLEIGAVSMGNPHAVLRVNAVETAEVETLGPALEHHPRFPQRANIGFMQIINRQHIQLRVFERGVGETPACGTGACAAVVVGIVNGWLDPEVQVDLPGGALVIHWQGNDAPVWMTGPAITVFEGEIKTETA